MKFFSSRLGEINIEEKRIITFPEGIPGFFKFKKYVLLIKENNPAFFFLHSIENKDLMFILTNPFYFVENYSFEISDEDSELLKINECNNIKSELGIFTIVKINKEKEFFINLKAPICINFKTMLGKQIILYKQKYDYSYKLTNFNKIPEKETSKIKLSKKQSFTPACKISFASPI